MLQKHRSIFQEKHKPTLRETDDRGHPCKAYFACSCGYKGPHIDVHLETMAIKIERKRLNPLIHRLHTLFRHILTTTPPNEVIPPHVRAELEAFQVKYKDILEEIDATYEQSPDQE